jgi:MFS family permease
MNRPAFTPPGAPATRVRYGVLAILSSMTFILYLDRVCIGQAATSIKDDLLLDDAEMGVVFIAFTIAYGLFEIPTGRWGDRYGSRGVLTRIVVWWSFFTALTGAATGFWMLLGVRFLFGAGEAGALPNSARVLRRWFPETARGRAQGWITTAMMLGGAAAPRVCAELLEHVGWRTTFVMFGALGVIWAWAFYCWFRDDPAQHPSVNAEELRLIAAGRADEGGHAAPSHAPIPWRIVLTSLNVWLMGALMNCGAAVYYFMFSWYPTYLKEARGASEQLSGWLSSLVLGGGALGCIFGGRLIDRLVRQRGLDCTTCRLVGIGALATGAASLSIAIRCDSTWLFAVFSAFTCFCLQLQIPTWWATVTKISGPHLGALFGLMNSLGVPGASASQYLFGWFVNRQKAAGLSGREAWDPGLEAYPLVLLTACAIWLVVNPQRSVVERSTGRPD